MNLEAVNNALAVTVRKQEEELKLLRAALETANANYDQMAAIAIDNAKDTERLRAAIAWIEPPFVDEKTPEAELRQRIAFAVADAKRAALTAQLAEGEK